MFPQSTVACCNIWRIVPQSTSQILQSLWLMCLFFCPSFSHARAVTVPMLVSHNEWAEGSQCRRVHPRSRKPERKRNVHNKVYKVLCNQLEAMEWPCNSQNKRDLFLKIAAKVFSCYKTVGTEPCFTEERPGGMLVDYMYIVHMAFQPKRPRGTPCALQHSVASQNSRIQILQLRAATCPLGFWRVPDCGRCPRRRRVSFQSHIFEGESSHRDRSSFISCSTWPCQIFPWVAWGWAAPPSSRRCNVRPLIDGSCARRFLECRNVQRSAEKRSPQIP